MKNNFKIGKNQLIYIILVDIFIFITLGVVIYELKKLGKINISYIMLGIIFILMGINQYIYYKNNKTKKYLIMTIIYSIIGAVILIYSILRFI